MMLQLVVRLGAVSSAVGHFLKVENLEPRTEAFPHNFTVCITAMFEFSNVLQVDSCSLVSVMLSRVHVAPMDLRAASF